MPLAAVTHPCIASLADPLCASAKRVRRKLFILLPSLLRKEGLGRSKLANRQISPPTAPVLSHPAVLHSGWN